MKIDIEHRLEGEVALATTAKNVKKFMQKYSWNLKSEELYARFLTAHGLTDDERRHIAIEHKVLLESQMDVEAVINSGKLAQHELDKGPNG